jgi:hypothetical protein
MKQMFNVVVLSMAVLAGFARAEQDLTTNDATSADPQVRQACYLEDALGGNGYVSVRERFARQKGKQP